MFLRFILFIQIFIYPTLASSQHLFQEDPVKLKEVTVTSSRLEDYAIGATVTSPDSALVEMHREQPLASLLTYTPGITLKTYGPGGLASVSLRGGLNDHTAILWNGLNIKSPMNGGMNLSVMPVGFFSNVRIQYGGAGTLYGSGAVSGVIHLSGNDLLNMPDEVNAAVTIGSFGFDAVNAGLRKGGKKFSSHFSVFTQRADNDFTFENTSRYGKPDEKQTNAGVEQYGILQENQWRISEHSLLTTGVWYQFYNKDLQTLMTSRRPNNTNQEDHNLAVSLNYKYYYGGGTLVFRQGLIRNRILYSDPEMADPQSDNNSLSWISEAEYKYRLSKMFSVNGGINHTYENARSDGYTQIVTRSRWSVFASGRMEYAQDRGAAVLSLRDETTDGDFQPVVFSLGLEQGLLNKFKIRANVSKNYRIPNLNDLYWKEDGYSAGNPDLKAESGWSGDAGIEFFHESGGFGLKIRSTFFASKTKDLIVWLPENGGKWMPYNKDKGGALGVESGIEMKVGLGQYRLNGNFFYTYTESTLWADDEYNGQQMVYIPKNKITGSMSIRWKAVYGTLAGRFVGERFYDYRNTIDPYFVGDATLGYRVSFGKIDADVSLKVFNITGESYQVVAWYAMPPCNYQFTVNIII